jgi:hypothetical protein
MTEGGGGFTWRTPYGMTTNNRTLPHLPYANPQDAVIQVRRSDRVHLRTSRCGGPIECIYEHPGAEVR